MSPFDNLTTVGGDAAFAAAVQSLTNPYAMAQYLSTRAVLQPQLFLQGLLPPVRSTTAQILNGNTRIIAGAAKATAIDSPYHKVGAVQTQFTRNNTFKLTSTALLNESDQDTMHEAAQAAIVSSAMNGGMGMASAGPVYLNYVARVIEAAALSLDLGEEMYRAQALAYGKLNLNVSNGERKIPVKADYGVNFADAFRDRSKGDTSYVGSNSAFWDDVQAARDYLLLAEPVMITNPTTWQAIKGNAANRIIVKSQTQLTPTTRRLEIGRAALVSGGTPSNAFVDLDVSYECTVIVYGLRDEETREYYWPTGRVTWFTQTDRNVTLIDGVIVSGALGVTHQGPTTEIGNVPGRYLNPYIPQGRPYQFIVDAAEDIVPELQNPRNLFFADTAVK